MTIDTEQKSPKSAMPKKHILWPHPLTPNLWTDSMGQHDQCIAVEHSGENTGSMYPVHNRQKELHHYSTSLQDPVDPSN